MLQYSPQAVLIVIQRVGVTMVVMVVVHVGAYQTLRKPLSVILRPLLSVTIYTTTIAGRGGQRIGRIPRLLLLAPIRAAAFVPQPPAP
jgi:hypothetical protein